MADSTKEQQRKQKMKVSLVFLPLPGLSHLVAMVELAKTIILHHNKDPDHEISVTILSVPPVPPSPQLSSYIASVAAGSGEDVNFRELPNLDPSLAANTSGHGSFLSTLMGFLKPHVRSTIQDVLLSSPVAALVVDMFCVDMIDVADELGIPCYVFFTSSATLLGFMFYLPTLHALLPAGEDMEELQGSGATIDLPGFSSPVPPMVMPEPFLHRKEPDRIWYMHFGNRFVEATGFIVNSYLELQPQKFKALEEGCCSPQHPTPPVYPVGPMLSLGPNATSTDADDRRHECLRWLDGQPAGSVALLCFGSLGSFSKKQATEVANGLERSGHRFLWVLRSPPPEHLRRIPGVAVDADLREVLPEGFLERIEGRGMVWPKYAPQTAILAHKAVGGFVTHCGWNSILESLWFGVPMLAWPLCAEQHLNAFEMVTEMGIAMELKMDRTAGNWVAVEEIERGVRCLMETDSMERRKLNSKATELSEKGKEALMEGGSSFRSLHKLTKMFLSNVAPRTGRR